MFGELHLVDQSRGPVIWQVTPEVDRPGWSRSQPERPCAWLRPMAGRYPTRESVDHALRCGRLYLSDGPIFIDALEGMILGRVVGLYERPTPKGSPS